METVVVWCRRRWCGGDAGGAADREKHQQRLKMTFFLLSDYEMKKAYPLLISLFFSIQKKLVKTFSGIK